MSSYDFQSMFYTISDARIKSYVELGFTPQSENLMRAYFGIQEIASHFFVPLQVLEISMRNSMHRCLSERAERLYGAGSVPWYDELSLTRESHRIKKEAKNKTKRDAKKRGSEKYTEDDLISNLSFGFWVHLLNDRFSVVDRGDPLITNNIWQVETNNVFPYRGKYKIREMYDILKGINTTRNRLFHQEPIWKSKTTICYKTAIEKMMEKYGDITKAIGWISQDKKRYMEDELCFKEKFEACCERHTRWIDDLVSD